jgi:hypothetical protein
VPCHAQARLEGRDPLDLAPRGRGASPPIWTSHGCPKTSGIEQVSTFHLPVLSAQNCASLRCPVLCCSQLVPSHMFPQVLEECLLKLLQ